MFKSPKKKSDIPQLKRYATYGVGGGIANSCIWFLRSYIDGEVALLTSQALLKSYFVYLSIGITIGTAIPVGMDLLMSFLAYLKESLTQRGYISEDPLVADLKAIRSEIAVFAENVRQHSVYQSEEAHHIEELLKEINEGKVRAMEDYECIITQAITREPVKAGDEHYYEKAALQAWYDKGHRSCILNHHIPLEDPKNLVVDVERQNEIIDLLQNLSNKEAESPKRCFVM